MMLLSEGGFMTLVVLALVLVVAMVIFGHLAAKKRREALAAWARGHGLGFDPERDSGMDNRYPAFECLQEGSRRYAFNVMSGAYRGRELVAFDYHYATRSTGSRGRRKTHHHYFSAAIVSPGFVVRPLFLRPEGFFDKVKAAFGYDDIDFESAEFSKRFFVKSPDRRWAYDVIHARTMEFLLAAPRHSLEFHDRSIIVWNKTRWDLPQLEAAIGVIHGVLDRLPAYVVDQQRGGRQSDPS